MKSEADLRRNLERRGTSLLVGDPPIDAFVRRGRRRTVRRRVEAGAAMLLVAVGLAWSIASLSPDGDQPAPVTTPRPGLRYAHSVSTGLKVATSFGVVDGSVWVG